jgi:signal transduction histidine kinase
MRKDMLIVIIILSCVIIFLVVRILLLKRIIKSITHRLLNGNYENPVTFSLVDKDVIELGKVINKGIEYHNMQVIEITKKEAMLKDMILNISHDLRTPLTAIMGYIQLLQESDMGEEEQKYVNIIMGKSKDLSQLISDFYELSMLESAGIEPLYQEIDLVETLTNHLLSYADLLEARQIEPEIIKDNSIVNISADELMLKRVFNNLIANAIKYSKKTLKIYIETNDFVKVTFENDIVETSLDVNKIFDKFYTGNSARMNGNTGLGLYIAKELMNKMGGEIFAKLNEDKLQIILLFKEK